MRIEINNNSKTFKLEIKSDNNIVFNNFNINNINFNLLERILNQKEYISLLHDGENDGILIP